MNWLESLLWDPASVAHIVCLYAFVISLGVLLGKIKFFGVSLGVTFVLFTGILMGHSDLQEKSISCISCANSALSCLYSA